MNDGDHINNDNDLWQAFIRDKEEYAFEILYKKYFQSLTRFAWRYVKSKAIAEEIVQEMYTDIWISGESWDISGSVRSYLYRIVRNKSLNHIKHQNIRDKYDPLWVSENKQPEQDFSDREREEEIRSAIKHAVDNLPERSQMTYKLHRYDGLTYDEISRVMDVSVKTVESQMTRTLRILRKRLAYLLA